MPILPKPKHVKAYDDIDPLVDIFTDGSALTTPGTRLWLLKYSVAPCFYDPEPGRMKVVLEGTEGPITIYINESFETYNP